jgi:NSS family neurotransmitter:Na+ symporter
MIAELLIGHRTRRNPVGAFRKLAPHSPWVVVGGLGVLTGFVILSYYSVVAGWAIEYTGRSISGAFGQRAELAREHLWRGFEGSGDDWDSWRREVLGPEASASAGEELDAAWTAFCQARPRDHEEARQVKAEALWTEAVAGLSEEESTRQREELAAAAVSESFVDFIQDPHRSLMWHFVFMVLTFGIVVGGVSRGIERWSKVLMPALLALLLILLGNSLTSAGAGKGLAFMFNASTDKLTGTSILEALGHAFFTLSLGMGAMITYGSYLQDKGQIVKNGLTVVFLDTLIALLACMVIFPIIFTFDIKPSASIGILFMTIPNVFAQMPGGTLWSTLFYLLVGFAALTSGISVLEVVVSWLIDERGWSRVKASVVAAGAIFLYGIPSAFANGVFPYTLGDVFGLAKDHFEKGSLAARFLQSNFLDLMDYLASNWFLPLGGLLIAVYVGWMMTRRIHEEEVAATRFGRRLLPLWRFLLRWVAPAGIVIVFLNQIGVI